MGTFWSKWASRRDFIFFIMTVIFFLFSFPVFEISRDKIYKIFQVNVVISIIVSIAYDFIQYKHFIKFGYQNPVLLYLLGVVTVIIVVLNNRSIKNIFVICSIYSVMHFLLSVHYFPLVSGRSDMLEAIYLSIQQFMLGVSPYYKSNMEIGVPPYLPFTMISFIPAYLLQIDFRFLGVVYWIISILLILYKFDKLSLEQKLASSLLIVNPYFLMRHEIYFQVFLLEIVILCLYVDSLKLRYKIIFAGVFISTLQFAWILCPFILLSWSKSIRHLAINFILTIIVSVVITFVYIHNGVHDFLNAIFLHKEYSHSYSSDITFGLSTIFYFAKSQITLYVFQLSCCLIILLVALYFYTIKQMRSPSFYTSLGAICYMFFLSTNYFIETYLLIPMLLFVILSLTNAAKIQVEDLRSKVSSFKA